MREGQTVVDARAGARVGPGTRLSDLYEIDEPIAVGGMGEVFRGHAIETGDTVAIKVMRAEFAENATALALFRKEASALHNVHHGAVVRYFVFSVDRRLGLPFLAMEYVTGASLADLLKRGPLGYEAVDTLRRRLAGLAGAVGVGRLHAVLARELAQRVGLGGAARPHAPDSRSCRTPWSGIGTHSGRLATS